MYCYKVKELDINLTLWFKENIYYKFKVCQCQCCSLLLHIKARHHMKKKLFILKYEMLNLTEE